MDGRLMRIFVRGHEMVPERRWFLCVRCRACGNLGVMLDSPICRGNDG